MNGRLLPCIPGFSWVWMHVLGVLAGYLRIWFELQRRMGDLRGWTVTDAASKFARIKLGGQADLFRGPVVFSDSSQCLPCEAFDQMGNGRILRRLI
jgi:hypothetical protein